MELLIGVFGSIASLLALALAFYAIFINGRAIRQMLSQQGQILERHGQMLERIEETLRYVAQLVKSEGEKTRKELRQD